MFSSLFSFHECFLFSGKKLKFVLFIECHTQNPLMHNIYESNQGSTELFIMPILSYLRMFVFLLLMEYGRLLTQNLKLRGNIARDMVCQTPWLPSEAVWLTSCHVSFCTLLSWTPLKLPEIQGGLHQEKPSINEGKSVDKHSGLLASRWVVMEGI